MFINTTNAKTQVCETERHMEQKYSLLYDICVFCLQGHKFQELSHTRTHIIATIPRTQPYTHTYYCYNSKNSAIHAHILLL